MQAFGISKDTYKKDESEKLSQAPRPHFLYRGYVPHKDFRVNPWLLKGKKLLPGGIFFVFSLIALVSLVGSPGLTPNFTLMALFHWGIYRTLPPFIFVIVGLIQDAVLGSYLGQNIFILTLMYVLIVSQRRYIFRQSFWVVWSIFASVTFIDSLLHQIIFGFLHLILADFQTWLMQSLLTIACYPLVVKVFVYVHRFMDS